MGFLWLPLSFFGFRFLHIGTYRLPRVVGWPSGIGWGDSVRTAVGSSPAPPTVRVAM